MIRVALADDHKMFMDGLKALIGQEKDIEVIGSATSGPALLNMLEEIEVDILVLDIEMPEMDGIAVTENASKKYPAMRILILSMHDEKPYILELMRLGVAGYILKKRSREELIHAIRTIHGGQPYFNLEVLQQATRAPKPVDAPTIELTKKEEEILSLIGRGKTTKEIAAELFISPATVNTHRRNLLFKLNAPNDKHLVRYAIKHGYAPL